MWTVRELTMSGDRTAVNDKTFATKNEALSHIKGLNLGEKPTIAKVGHIYIVTLKTTKK